MIDSPLRDLHHLRGDLQQPVRAGPIRQSARDEGEDAVADEKPTDGFDALLTEDRTFDPPEEFARNANMNDPDIYAKADADPEAFWAGIAGELEWSRPWDTILDWQPPDAKWFIGGKINASVNCVDRHALGSRRDKRAIVWEGEPGDQKTLTYGELHAEVQKCANVLKRLGVGHGDRVAVYLPMIPELPIVMLACARIGAVHSVVFGGFSAESLRDRINDMQAKLLVTADGGFRRGGVVPLKEISDAALDGAPSVENVLLVKREGLETPFKVVAGRDHWYHELMSWVGETCPPRENDAEDLLFTLYTSGTTGKPKGIAHTTGGYLTGTYITTKWVFDLKEDDIYWCSADIGWVTGHSYLVYGPLANGATCVMYEGAPDTPGRDRFWDIIERHKVTVFYTAPTAIRAFMKWGPEHVSEARPEHAAADRIGRRADQSRGLDVVPPPRRRRPLPHRRHLVADRDRQHPDHPAAGADEAQAGLRLAAVPRPEAGHRHRERRAGRRWAAATWSRRAPGPRCCAPSTATTTATSPPTGTAGATRPTSPATAPRWTRTATSGCSAASTTS